MCISCLFRDIDKYLYLYGSLVSGLSTSSAILTHELTRNKKLQQKVGGGSGILYHTSDVKGREKVQ